MADKKQGAASGKLLRNRRARKRVLVGAGAVLLVLLLALAFRPSVQVVETAPVVAGPLEVTVDAEGVTRVVDRFLVAAPVSGRLQRVEAREGDAVSAGEVVARITPAPLDPNAATQARAAVTAAEARLEEANARVVQTEAAAAQAARTAARIGEVVAQGGMSVDALERAELEATTTAREHEAARSRVRGATSELAAARATLADADPGRGAGQAAVQVASPAAGRILRVHEQSERVVPAGTTLLEVGDAAGLEIVVDVLSTDAVRIRPGSRVRVTQWGGDEEIEGRVRLVEPAAFTRVSALGVEEQRVHVVGDLIAPPAALGDGYRVEAGIVVWEAERVLKVPSSALFGAGGERWRVFVVDDGRAVEREVGIGRRGESEAEVLDGLTEGEAVILFPSDQLRAGARVRPAD